MNPETAEILIAWFAKRDELYSLRVERGLTSSDDIFADEAELLDELVNIADDLVGELVPSRADREGLADLAAEVDV